MPTPTTLDELLAALQSEPEEQNDGASGDYAEAHGLPVRHGRLDWTSLPTFGGEDFPDPVGVWSWDADRLLVGTCADDLRIVDRAASSLGRRGGRSTSAAKRAASRANGAKGGRPREC